MTPKPTVTQAMTCRRPAVIWQPYTDDSGSGEPALPIHAETVKRLRKRVLKDQNGRRHCYTDKKQAMNSYLQRKHWQLSHAAMSEARGKAGVKAAKELLKSDGEITLPVTAASQHIQELNWGDY